MIPVRPSPEPPDFDRRVRRPGLAAFRRIGRADKAFWRRCHDALYAAGKGYCAYLAVRIPRSPVSDPRCGGSSVDHFLPRDRFPRFAYEWKNYRLACSAVNSRKGDAVGILDPFRMKKEEADWFFLNPLTGTLSPNPALSARRRRAVENTIQALGLNQKIFCDYRLDLLDLLEQDDGAESLRCESPFLLAEAVRLRLL